MLSIWQRWRILKSIESGDPLPRSIASALQKTSELRTYADSMRRVHEGLRSPEEVCGGAGLVGRVLGEIEGEPVQVQTSDGYKSAGARLEPMGFIRPLGLAAAVAVVSGITVLSIRPWSVRPTIEVTGEFTSLISLFQPIGDEGLIGWIDQSLADEYNAITQDTQNILRSVVEGFPGAVLMGENKGGNPG